jgi:hypothetical protein
LSAGFGAGAREFYTQLCLGHSNVLPGQIGLDFSDDIGVAQHFEIILDDSLGVGICRLAFWQSKPLSRPYPNNRLRRALTRNASS